ncbi:gliding motility-associated C-terminal domain-containing protein, partial [Flavobacterium sp. AS60]|uniref:gliding motility-associated C-terminal domain-containing protein n=1 Tax=Flavobacterium anseongense TaxID=2910677 RepID=UPI001F3F9DFC
TTTTCPSLPGQTTVVINPLADAGNDGTLDICSNQNAVDLFNSLLGTPQAGGTWSPALASGSGTFNPAVDPSGVYTYTVAGIAPCVDDTATVTVVVTQGPEAGNDNSLVICINNPAQDLFLLLGPNAEVGGTWVPAMASGSGVFDPAVDPQGNYTYTLSGTAPCSNDIATISVTVNPIPDAGTDGTKTFCSNGSPEDLFLSLGGTPQTGGIWSPALASGTGFFDPTIDTAGTYTYTVGSTCITPSAATVTVSITQAPNTGGVGQTLNTCANVTSLDLFTGLDGTQDAGNWSDDDATGALINNFFNPSAVGVGTYHFTYTVLGTSPCADGTSTVTVIVNPLPNAGDAVTIPPVCTSVGTIDLNTLLTGQDAGGTWSATTPVDISAFVAGTYTYTYSVTNSCGTDTQDVQFTVLPNPIIASSNITISPICIGLDVTVNLTGMVDGTYTLNYDLSGSNTLANQNVTVVVSGGNGSFTIPAANVPNIGTTTITFNTIQDLTTTCLIALSNAVGTIVINPIVQIDNANIAVSTICIGSVATVVISNATNLPDGVYQFNYSIPTGTPATGNSGDITITGGNGQFTIPASVFATVGSYTITISSITTTTGCSNMNEDANITFAVVAPLTAGTFTGLTSVCPSVGIIDLAALLNGEDAGGVWTDSASVVVTSPINISGFSAGTYTYTYRVDNACGPDTEQVQFTVYANPQLTTLNISTSPTCIGTNAIVNLNGMVDGTYTLNYDLSGSNTLAGQSVIVTIAAGIGNFTIPTASIPNVGTTVISFTSITNNATTCTNILVNVAIQLIIRPLADIDNANLSIANVCLGNGITVNINGAINLPDGVYQFNYSIPGATPVTGNSGDVTVTSGVGQFAVPSTVFTTAGNYTLTVNGIIAATGCTNAGENATANFTINPIPNAGTATVSAQDTCPNSDSNVTITGISNLPDGTYSLTYQLSGANSGTATISVTFTNGGATFIIPGASILNNGQTTIQITDLTSPSNTCGLNGAAALAGNFDVVSDPAPVLIDRGELFCGTNVPAPTIADLSANIVGTPTMIWYDALTGGTAYNPSDLLINGVTYYGAVVSATGCESLRLSVTVDLTVCDVIIPDGFSPNNDGINDTFEIPNLAILYPNFKLEIYNRYGSLIYTGNRNKENWDGTTTEGGLNLGDKLLPTGVYFYILDFRDGTRKAIQGRLYLNR